MIIAAAIEFYIKKTGEHVVLCGARHGDIYNQLKNLGFKPHQGYKEICQGFIDNTNTFMDRKTAYFYALMKGQITEKETEELFSEDLW